MKNPLNKKILIKKIYAHTMIENQYYGNIYYRERMVMEYLYRIFKKQKKLCKKCSKPNWEWYANSIGIVAEEDFVGDLCSYCYANQLIKEYIYSKKEDKWIKIK